MTGNIAATTSTRRRHWETIYRTRPEDELSWHQDEPTLSLRLIRGVTTPSSRIIDIGGGSSPLADRLRRAGYRHITVLDVSVRALERSRTRSPDDSGHGIRYLVADITEISTLPRADLWHDRAVFHFLTSERSRRNYVELAAHTLPVGGHLVLATFALSGPAKCSGLPVARYDAEGLAGEFGDRFVLVKRRGEIHRTPWRATQPFTYVVLQRRRARRAKVVS